MQLRSGKTTFSVLKQQPVDDTNVFGTKTFIKTGLKYIEDINNTFIEETQSGVIRKIKKCMSMFEYFYNTMFKTIFYNTTSDYIKMCDIFSTTVIKVCTNLELKVNNKITKFKMKYAKALRFPKQTCELLMHLLNF